MKRMMGWMVVSALIAWAPNASADVANDDCGGKDVGDPCEDFSGAPGVCFDDDGEIICDITDEPAAGASGSSGSGGAGGSTDSDDDDGGCSVRNVGSGGKGEAAALGLLLLVCIALRKRFD